MRHSLSADMHGAMGDLAAHDAQQDELHHIRLGDGVLAYRRTGDASSPTLLLIHGWGGASRYWLPTMRSLADAFCSYAPDLPGFGHSSPLPSALQLTSNGATNGTNDVLETYSHRSLARVIVEFMDALAIERCDVIGHSYGSGVAIALAAMHPGRVRRLIISNFSTFRDERERRFVAFMHHVTGLMVRARGLPFARSDAFATMLGGRYFHRLPADRRILRDGLNDFMQMDAQAADLTVKQSLGWETPQDMARLEMPVLLIHCRNDQIMPPRNAEYTAQLAPHGQIVWIDECGHLPMIEQHDQFVRIVRRFLQVGST